MPTFKRVPARQPPYASLPEWKRAALRKKAGGLNDAQTGKLYRLINDAVAAAMRNLLSYEIDPDFWANRTRDTVGIRRFVKALQRLNQSYELLSADEEARLAEAFYGVEEQERPIIKPGSVFEAMKMVQGLASIAYDLEHGSGRRGRPKSPNRRTFFMCLHGWQKISNRFPNLAMKSGVLPFYDEYAKGTEFSLTGWYDITRSMSPTGNALQHTATFLFVDYKESLRAELTTAVRRYMKIQHKFLLPTNGPGDIGDEPEFDEITPEKADQNVDKIQ